MTLKKLLLVFICFSALRIYAQNLDTGFYNRLRVNSDKSWAEKLKADSLAKIEKKKEQEKKSSDNTGYEFDRLFGCSCCADTLRWYMDKSLSFVLSNSKTILTAYKANKKKWQVDVKDLFRDPYAKVTCMEFRTLFKTYVIRITIDEKGSRAELNLKTGKVEFKERAP